MRKYLIGMTITTMMLLPTITGAEKSMGQGVVVIEDPWARASIGTSRPGGAYMVLRNTSEVPMTLTGMEADIAGMVSIHQTTTNADGVSSMGSAGEIEIAAGGTLALEPGSYHAMLMQLQEPLVEGETFSLMITFADGTELMVDVPVLGIGARGPEG